jgi:hypothetical protein
MQPGPAIGQHHPKRRPRLQRRGPRRATAIAGPLTQHPGHALRFHSDQDGLTAEEDLIQAGDDHQRLAGPVQMLQQTTSLDGFLMDPATHGGVARTECGGQDDGQQAGDLARAEAHRRRHDGEVAALGLGELDGLPEPLPELAILLAEGLDLVEQLLSRRPAVGQVRHRLLDPLGVLVEGLSARADRVGVLGHIAPSAGEDRRRIADPDRHG